MIAKSAQAYIRLRPLMSVHSTFSAPDTEAMCDSIPDPAVVERPPLPGSVLAAEAIYQFGASGMAQAVLRAIKDNAMDYNP